MFTIQGASYALAPPLGVFFDFDLWLSLDVALFYELSRFSLNSWKLIFSRLIELAVGLK